MDALPGPEESGLEFASTRPAAHLCGHDNHMAMVLGAALIVDTVEGRKPALRLVFQPQEEAPPGGALGLIEEGVCDGLDAMYALHVDPTTDCGHIATRPGPFFAAPDNFRLVIQGRGCHAATPHSGIDPISIAAQLILALQHIPSRITDPFDPVVISVASIAGGNNYNVIPDSVELKGTYRTFSESARQRIRVAIERTANNVAAAFGATVQFEVQEGYDSVVNSPCAVAIGKRVASDLFGEDFYNASASPFMFGEDFSYYLKNVPGALFMIGAGASGVRYPLHNRRVVFNEGVLWRGAAFLAAMAMSHAEK
jgi:amidohydrolase